jgi:hypothetical protein
VGERSRLEMVAFAAWVNVPVDQVPATMRATTCKSTMAAWKRVADAIYAQAARDLDPSLRPDKVARPDIADPALKRAVTAAGSQSAFAAAVGTSQQLVSYWLAHGKPLPAEFVLAAEQAFGTPRHELRPDIYPET